MLLALWDEFLQFVSESKDENRFIHSILKQLEPAELGEDKIILKAESQGFKFFIQKKIPVIEKQLELFLKKKIVVEIIVVPKKKPVKESPLFAYAPTIDDVFHKAGLHGKYSFDNFAVSQTNQIAYAASRAVAENLGKSYNPLLLWGGVGVGKTHLAQAVARDTLEKTPTKKVLFCPGDQFTNELIESIREKSTTKFRKKYRTLDLFIVDDVQFIAGKNSVQEEMFHTFNAIISKVGGQIILTSDKPPAQIKNLEDRLRSRFLGGLNVDVQSPDFELRTAILLIKAKEKSIELDIEAAKIIAEQITDSRGLEGALLSLYAQTLGGKNRVDLEELEQYFQGKKTGTSPRKVGPHEIISAVCLYFNVKQSQIKGTLRSDHMAKIRQITMFLLRRELGLTYVEIATFLKRKDHTTVIHGFNKIARLIATDANFKAEIDRISRSITTSTSYSL